MGGITVDMLINGGALAALIWIVFHTFKVLIPQTNKQFTDALDRQQEAFTGTLVKHTETVDETLKNVVKSVDKQSQMLLIHDATVRGVNPNAAESGHESMVRVYEGNGD